MKLFPVLAGLAVLLIACAPRESRVSGVEKLEKTTWNGHSGTAMTISVKMGTKDLQGASMVGLRFIPPSQRSNVTDLTAPVIKVESQTVTLVFPEGPDQMVPDTMYADIRAGNLVLHACVPNKVC